MRLPAFKVYRAFPELDRFSDEQCEAFLKAARRGRARRVGRLAAQAAATALALALGAAAYLGLVRLTGLDPTANGAKGAADVCFGLALAAEFCLAGGAWLLAKDRLLRGRIRRVINTRGSCPVCGYMMVGLPVASDLVVRCPECGFALDADPSLGEVAKDESGAARFLPSPDVVPAFERLLTPGRVRVLRRLLIGVPASLVVLALLAWGGYEWFLSRQAARARADRTGVRALIDLCEKNQPEGAGPGSPDAWVALERAERLMARTDIRVMREGPVEFPTDLQPDFYEIFSPSIRELSAEERPARAAARELAITLIGAYREAGVFVALDEAASCRRAVPVLTTSGADVPPVMMPLTNFGAVRQAYKVLSARMTLAVGASDLGEFVAAVDSMLGLAKALRRGPLLIDQWFGDSFEYSVEDQIAGVLGALTACEWVEAIERSLDGHDDDRSFVPTLEGARLQSLDTAAWLFSEPSRVRLGKWSKAIVGLVGNDRYRDLGTYRANRDSINAMFDEGAAMIVKEPYQRPGTWDPKQAELLLPDVLERSVRRAIRASESLRVRARGLRLLVALKRYWCEHGDYPETLEQLVPVLIASLPLDPYTGKNFGYRRIAAPNFKRSSFVLYSTGADGVDNSGTVSPSNESALWPGTTPGYDYIIGPAGAGLPAK